ncbi:MAG: hypothetical protein Q7S15_01470 [bacterium]|nr:hypothetical protein [bacterium]
MKKIAGIIVIVILLGILLAYAGGQDKVIGKDIEIARYTTGGRLIDKGTLRIPFRKTLEERAVVDAYVDMNGDGKLTGEEHIVKARSVSTREGWSQGFPVIGSLPEKEILVKITVGDETLEKKARILDVEIGDSYDLSTVTNPEEAMKGWGIALAHDEPATSAVRPGVPDLKQRKDECAPTAAANSIMSLAEKNGVPLSDLPTPTEIVDGLKGDMDWTPQNGVLPDAFVAGKNQWAARNGLPIRTEKVGDTQGASTAEKILDAMADGAAAELRIRFSTPDGRVVGGHMVTVVGVRTEGGETFVDINDPATPTGTETYTLNGNILEGYPFEFLTTISWGFVQRWEGTPTGTALDPMTDEEMRGIKEFVGEKEKIKVIVVRGKKVPIAQVHVATGSECDKAPHYHANAGSVTALDGSVLADPGGCGYGKVAEVPIEDVEI